MMIRLLIRKSFSDLWDNLFTLVLVNAGLLLVVLLPLIPLLLLAVPGWLVAVLFALSLLAACVWLAAAMAALSELTWAAAGERLSIRQLVLSLRRALRPGASLAALIAALGLALWAVVPRYLESPSFFSLFMLGIIGWFGLFCLAAGQYYLPLFMYARLRGYATSLPAIMKRCLLFFMDNPGFSLFLLLHSLFYLILSALPAFLIPGPAGVLLGLSDAVYLRMFKYDWLESLPASATRRQVPWSELLAEEEARLGSRSLKSLIFPWKE
ncbi:MAG: hypothetical protein KKI09_02725 [Spirochaetes bacterium]|nr:hypothetical protein [Spirochaetota bacterium]